jgi:hypothetical protein
LSYGQREPQFTRRPWRSRCHALARRPTLA